MLKLVIDADTSHGPFTTITRESDHYVCDNAIYYFSVIGEGTDGEDIVDWEGALPEPEVPQYLVDTQRAKRDLLLADSDWTQMADSALTDEKKTEWATYRQTLRDVPSQDGFPRDITWPSEP